MEVGGEGVVDEALQIVGEAVELLQVAFGVGGQPRPAAMLAAGLRLDQLAAEARLHLVDLLPGDAVGDAQRFGRGADGAGAGHGAHAPPVVRVSTLAGLVATALVTALTTAGLKVSGHVAVPVGVLALLAGSSQRGLWPFAVAALAVSWARVREGRHTPREVLVGWGVASASGLLARWGF